MSNILMIANNVAHVALDWWTDDGISYDEEQLSGNNVTVPAIIRPHLLSSRSDKVDSSIKEVDACTRNFHSVLTASSVVYGRNTIT